MKEKRSLNSCLGRRDCMWLMMKSTKRLKSMGDMGHPCLSPLMQWAVKRAKPLTTEQIVGAGVQVLDEVDDGVRYVVVGEYLP